MMRNLIKITINLMVGALILGSPMAFGNPLCAGSSCCCAPPELTDAPSISRASCCPCGTFETQDKPIQEAVIELKISHQPIRPELDSIGPDFSDFDIDYICLKINHNISIHSPPLDIGLLNTPLLC